MAEAISNGAHAPSKPYTSTSSGEPPHLVGGIVRHDLVSASVQVTILALIDATGSAEIGDICVALAPHPDPVGAVLIMAEVGIVDLEIRRVLDAATVVRRASHDPDQFDEIQDAPSPSVSPAGSTVSRQASIPVGLERLDPPFSASVIVGGAESRRDFARMPELRRPGVYGLISATSAYIGTGGDVAHRVATGQQPIDDIESIFVITDSTGTLTETDARAAERILWSRIAASRERRLANVAAPDGASVSPQRYSEINAWVAQACLALRHSGLVFTGGTARNVLAGPRSEPGRVAPLRPLDSIPEGQILELGFGNGMIAMAARQSERWMLLRGSDVRIETVSSANSTTRFLRSAWLHAGILELSPDGRSYVTTRDVAFLSGSACSQFVTGSKGYVLASWTPIDPHGGYDPTTPALIAA